MSGNDGKEIWLVRVYHCRADPRRQAIRTWHSIARAFLGAGTRVLG